MNKYATGMGAGLLREKVGLVMLLVAIAMLAGAIVYRSGDADLPQTPLDTSAQSSIEELKRAAEASTDDAGPWQALGFAYFQRNEFAEAVGAYERAVAIDNDEAVLWSALGEARVMASERDPMPPEAAEAFSRALALDANDPRSLYFANVKKDLDGDHDGAIAGWLALLAQTPAGAPWERDLVRTIEQVGKLNEIEVQPRIDMAMAARPGAIEATGAAPRGPTQAELAAAGSIPPSEQRAMAEGMVERLEQRLDANPKDVAGWVMLMRSRMTLEQPDLAREALAAALRTNPQDENRLRREAQALGVR